MWLLLDTNVLMWTVYRTARLSSVDRETIQNPENEVAFSPVSIWEVAIKSGLGRSDFTIQPAVLLAGARQLGFEELAVTAEDALGVLNLPRYHRDPFDRMLVAQAVRGSRHLLTADRTLLRYSDLVKLTA